MECVLKGPGYEGVTLVGAVVGEATVSIVITCGLS